MLPALPTGVWFHNHNYIWYLRIPDTHDCTHTSIPHFDHLLWPNIFLSTLFGYCLNINYFKQNKKCYNKNQNVEIIFTVFKHCNTVHYVTENDLSYFNLDYGVHTILLLLLSAVGLQTFLDIQDTVPCLYNKHSNVSVSCGRISTLLSPVLQDKKAMETMKKSNQNVTDKPGGCSIQIV